MSAPAVYLGLDDPEKARIIADYRAEHGIERMIVLSPERFAPAFCPERATDPMEHCTGRTLHYLAWPDVILYRFYYRLLQEIDGRTLIVVNEGLRSQDRSDLTYNCVRNFLNQTQHVLVFQYLPLIDSLDDFGVLFDFVTRSKWKREPVTRELLREATIRGRVPKLEISPHLVPVDSATSDRYQREREALFAEVRASVDKDPHVLPRTLAQVGGKTKLAHLRPGGLYVGRNDRFKVQGLVTYRDVASREPRTVFELPHAFLDFADFLTVTRQSEVTALIADLPADRWYLRRYTDWAGRLQDAAATLHG